MKLMKPMDAGALPTCLVKGRHFVQRGRQWVDVAVEAMPQAKRLRVRFDSREFFELLIKNPQTQPYLAVGRNLKLVVGDTVVEIYE